MTTREKTGLEYLADGGIRRNGLFEYLDMMEIDMVVVLRSVLDHCDMLETRIRELEDTMEHVAWRADD